MPRTPAFLFAAFLCAATAHAQTTYTAAKINFNHPGDFTQDQLESASGMHAGSTFTEADLAAAAQKLADTGFFDNISVTLDGRVKSVTVLFDIAPIDRAHMLQVGFENFVWLTHDEVHAAVRAKMPLFSGYLPENVLLEDAVSAALVQALEAKGIADAIVKHETTEPTLDHPALAIEFRVVNPRPRVDNVKLAGVTPDLVPVIQKSVNLTAKSMYNEGLSGLLTTERILAPLLDAGYMRAELTNVSVAASAPDGKFTPLVVSATLAAGEPYHLASLNFAGAPLLSAEAFAATAKLHPGDLATRKALFETLAPLDAAYRRLGYLEVVIQTNPIFDATAHTVSYTVTVQPGEQYHLHQVTTQNLDPAAKAEFEKNFTMKPGDLYNSLYVTDFLKNPTLKALSGYSGTFQATADPSTHLVDLDIAFFGTRITVH